jgi:hypothetical protein
LRSADPAEEPLVDFACCRTGAISRRLRDAFRFVADVAMAPELDSHALQDLPDQLFGSGARRIAARPGDNAIQMQRSPRCSARCRRYAGG